MSIPDRRKKIYVYIELEVELASLCCVLLVVSQAEEIVYYSMGAWPSEGDVEGVTLSTDTYK